VLTRPLIPPAKGLKFISKGVSPNGKIHVDTSGSVPVDKFGNGSLPNDNNPFQMEYGRSWAIFQKC
jgi:hypothetical protein